MAVTTTALDPFEQQRFLLAVTLLAAFTNETAAPAPVPRRAVRAAAGVSARPELGRRHVRPARSC